MVDNCEEVETMVEHDEQEVLLFRQELCTGCLYCYLACSYEHFGVLSLSLSHIKIVPDESKPGYFIGIHCAHCDDPICEASCPEDAITKDEETGWVNINRMKCIGCKTCNIMCPISIPWRHPIQKLSHKCDFCEGDPKCAKFCPTSAIIVTTRREAEEYVEKKLGITVYDSHKSKK